MNKKASFIALLVLFLIYNVLVMNLVKADNAAVLSGSSFVDSAGYYSIVGEVQNTGSTTISSVYIFVTLYNANNQTLDTPFGLAFLKYIQPNSKSPFEIIDVQPNLYSQFDHYTLRVASQADGEIQEGLQIVGSSSYVDSTGNFQVVGNIKNIGTSASGITQVIATFYNGAGKVVDVGSNYTNPFSLPSGSTSPFTITCTDSSQIPLIKSYSLTAQSDNYALISASPNSTQTVFPTTNPNPTSLPSPAQEQTPSPSVPEFPNWIILPSVAVFATMIVYFRRSRKL
jgi:hypothetical protein